MELTLDTVVSVELGSGSGSALAGSHGSVRVGLEFSGPAEDCTEGDETKHFHLDRVQKWFVGEG